MHLHPQARKVVEILLSRRAVPYEQMTATQARDACNAEIRKSPEVLHEIRDIDAAEVPCRLYRPSAEPNLGLLVYYHGGGWVIGNLDAHDGICCSLSNKSGSALL